MVFGRAGYSARCPGCGLEHYPRTDPAIIVAVSDGPRLLLGRQASWPPNRWSVLAGFVEPGESLEQTVAREVMEEAGVPVLSCTYAASQPWPFPAALMVGFHAEGAPVEPVVSDELEQARWFSAADILMTHVLRDLRHTDILADFPALTAYVARCEARPAFKRALEDQLRPFRAAEAKNPALVGGT